VMVESIETRVDELSKKKIRFKVSKEELESAKSGLEWMKSEWAAATAALNDGKQIEASDKAKAVKAKGEEVKKTLGMKEA
jgi:septation ring formation regulator EzrA